MKKLLFGTAALLLMASCSGNGTSEKTREDSTHITDSIAQVETARQAEEAAMTTAEQVHLDSIRQDSINRIEKLNKFNLKPFIDKWEDGSYLKDFKEIKSFLTKEGFKIASKKKERIYYESDGEENYWMPDVYTFINSEIEIKVFSNCNDCPVQDIHVIIATDEIKENILSNTVRGMYKKGSVYYSSNSEATDVMISTKGKTIFLKNTL